ncbi:hypothetical protein N2152v2_005835 [Parachlorella kessleri]
MSTQMKGVRSSLEEQMGENEQLRVFMSSLRGSNLSDADFADSSVQMRLVEVTEGPEGDSLPLEYDPARIADYWGRRPVAVTTRILQLLGIAGGFLSRLAVDYLRGDLEKTQVQRAIDLRNIMTSLGPAYIKLGQALSIRPDLLNPAAMYELQKLCDKVPSFDSKVAMDMIAAELGQPWQEIYAELSPEPIAAASLGQVYKGRLHTGEAVAVKVQRPYVLETVTVDLFIIRRIGLALREFPQFTQRVDVVALLDEWASRFFEELDYVREGNNGTIFAEQMRVDLPQVVVPRTYEQFTSRRVLTTSWLDGEKLSQSKANDVGKLVNIGVICYLKQLLDTGFFHADPHPGNLIRTPDGRLAILDFGLMAQVSDDVKYGMIEAISHLIHRDYEAIVQDFVTLDFIPPGTDLRPILPVLAKVFDQALEGGGAKNFNFQELAADLAQITFDYPFRIPPYFAIVIRAIGVLEGIALVGDPDFALVDEAYPYLSKRLMTDDSPRLREALRYMGRGSSGGSIKLPAVLAAADPGTDPCLTLPACHGGAAQVYGRDSVFDADRLIDLLVAFETFTERSKSARGNLDLDPEYIHAIDLPPSSPAAAALASGTSTSISADRVPVGSAGTPGLPPARAGAPPQWGLPMPWPNALPLAAAAPLVSLAPFVGQAPASGSSGSETARTREALRFVFSPEGAFFRDFLTNELVRSIDALSREQLLQLLTVLGLQNARLPLLLPGARKLFLAVAPTITPEDRRVVENVAKLVDFLTGGSTLRLLGPGGDPAALRELLPFLPSVATQMVPEVSRKLLSRISARLIREVFI